MASVRKRGKQWYYSYTDEHGQRVERKGCQHKRATEEMGAEAEKRVALIRAGMYDPKAERHSTELSRPLREHLADFAQYMLDKGGNASHARVKANRAARLFELAGCSKLSEVTVSAIQGALAKLKEEKLSIQTTNHYLDAAKMFCTWLIRDGRASESPIAFMSRKSPLPDLRRVRRALSADECSRLIEALKGGQDILDVTPEDRAALYLIAIGTGFRAAELRSLTPERFNLAVANPSIIVKAGYTKNRKEAIQPIAPSLARGLVPWLATKEPGKPVFKIRLNDFAPMLRSDLKLAGIPIQTDEGVIDFHSLRSTFISLLVNSGATIKESQTLARHSTPVLTFGVYAKSQSGEINDAVGRLPDLTKKEGE